MLPSEHPFDKGLREAADQKRFVFEFNLHIWIGGRFEDPDVVRTWRRFHKWRVSPGNLSSFMSHAGQYLLAVKLKRARMRSASGNRTEARDRMEADVLEHSSQFANSITDLKVIRKRALRRAERLLRDLEEFHHSPGVDLVCPTSAQAWSAVQQAFMFLQPAESQASLVTDLRRKALRGMVEAIPQAERGVVFARAEDILWLVFPDGAPSANALQKEYAQAVRRNPE